MKMGKISDRQLKAEIENVYFNQLCKSKRLTYTEITEVAKYFAEWTEKRLTENLIIGTIGESQNGRFVRIQSSLGASAIPLTDELARKYELSDEVKIAILK